MPPAVELGYDGECTSRAPTSLLEHDLDVHRAALRACRACGDRVKGTRPIISLARRPRIMLVGQAPGQVERLDELPFAGRAGKTLFKWMAQAGISESKARERIYISAITRCYPGPSPTGRGDRVPSREEQTLCSSWLDAELVLIQPRLLIPVGRLAIDRFLEKAPLDLLIGREHLTEVHGVRTRVVPLPHPSGASSWIHAPGHQELLAAAIGILRRRITELL